MTIPKSHFGDPCHFCGVPHDEVEPGPCKGSGPTQTKIKEATAMTFEEWLETDEGIKRFGLKLRDEYVAAARAGWNAAILSASSEALAEAENEVKEVRAIVDATLAKVMKS